MALYRVPRESFSYLAFLSKEFNKTIISKEIIKEILEILETLSKTEKHAESLIVYLIFTFKLSPRDVRLLKFEDIVTKIFKPLQRYVNQNQ